jgi:hypothetical protein
MRFQVLGKFKRQKNPAFNFIWASAVLWCSSPLLKAAFPANFELSQLIDENLPQKGLVLNGSNAGDNTGRSVSSAGDINGDGLDDIIIGAHLADPNGKNAAGVSYVIFGSQTSFPRHLELSNLDGSNGFKLNGNNIADYAGISVSGVGDVNGDGIDDLIIGANKVDLNGPGSNSGQSYVVFGGQTDFPATVELNNLNGSNGFKFNGNGAFHQVGTSVSEAGDVNGDGLADIIIGAVGAGPNGFYSGQSYVIFGSQNAFPAMLSPNNLNGSQGFRINGIASLDRAGRSVSGAGDVNGDGLDDLIIGAYNADPNGSYSGQSYIVFGNANGFSADVELNNLNGNSGFKLNGGAALDRVGIAVSDASDVNGDGLDDFIVSASSADPNGPQSGQIYLVFGNRTGFPTTLELNNLDGSNGFKLNGIAAGDYAGVSANNAGDINGDGLHDLIIGAPGTDSNGMNAGQVYVIFGNRFGFPNIFELNNLNGKNGFKLNGIAAEDRAGNAVSGAGDINGDGIDDVIIAASFADPNSKTDAGQAYVIYGQDYSLPGDFTGNSTPDLLIRKPGKKLRILPLTLDGQTVSSELTGASDLALPSPIVTSEDRLPKKTKLLGSLDFDDKGVSDILVREGKDKLKLYQLANNGLPQTPTILGEINFDLPKKHRYVGAGSLIGNDDKLDLVLKKGKLLFVAENLGNGFSTELQSLSGKLQGKILSIQKNRILTIKGKKLNQYTLNNILAIGAKSELGSLAKGQKPVAMLDINQDGKLDILAIDKKKNVGFVSEDNLNAEPTPIITLPKTKILGPK